MINCNSANTKYMKHISIFSILVIGITNSQSQSLLLKKNPENIYKYDPGKYFDKKEYMLLVSPKNFGTFIYTESPLKATYFLLNLDGKFSSSPIQGVFVASSKNRTISIDSLPQQQAKFLYNTEKGKAYALPLDNMPCLVPHTNSNMPVAKIDIEELKKMPNAFQKQNIIPNPCSINSPENTDK